MKRTLTALFLAYALVLSTPGPVARAQSTLNTETKAKSEVVERINKKETHVKIKLRNGSEMKGRITQSNDTGFTLSDEKTGNSSNIAYADVVNVEGRGMSKKKKTLIAVGVVVGVAIAVIAYGVTHFWD
jgi:sRNA-binding regulator protein Hfq